MKIKNKNSQQEIVGFMIIILMVVIVGVIFLGIYMRKAPPIVQEDAEIMNFLDSSFRYTTECYKDNEPNYRDLGKLVEDCKKSTAGITCPSNKDACFIANYTYSVLLEKLWQSGKDRPTKYTKLSFFYQQNASEETRVKFMPTLNKGATNLTGCVARAGSMPISIDPGNIVIELEICKGA